MVKSGKARRSARKVFPTTLFGAPFSLSGKCRESGSSKKLMEECHNENRTEQ
jgi:hypothetical protein